MGIHQVSLSLARLFLFLAIVLFHGPSFADTVVMGGDRSYPPHQYLNEDNEPAGFDVDIFRAIVRDQGLQLDFDLGQWSDVQAKLKVGAVDVVPMFVSERRRQDYLFTVPFLNEYYLLMGRRGAGSYDSLDEVGSHTIAVQRGGFIWHHLREHYPDLALIEVETEPAAVRLVVDGNADLALVSVHAGTYIVAENRYTDIISVSPPLVPANYAFAVAADNKSLLKTLNRGLGNIRADGTYDRIYQKWVSNPDQIYTAYQRGWRHSLWIIATLVVIGLLLLVALAYFWGLIDKLRRWSRSLHQRAVQAESHATRLSLYDSLTNLPKRQLFENYLDSALGSKDRSGGILGVGFIGITDFSRLQIMLGFSLAEECTRAVAGRLFQHINDSIFISYFGDGKFGLIVEQPDTRASIYNEVFRIIRDTEGRVVIQNLPIDIRLSCGLAFFPEHGGETDALSHAAAAACAVSLIKRNNLIVYDPSIEPDTRQISLMSDLRLAIQKDALGWVFQPIYSLKEKRIISAEMLVRWEHHEYGALAPDLFIPMAEESGVIRELTRHLLVKAAGFSREWQSRGLDLGLSINVSSNDLADPALANELLDKFRDSPHPLTLEITETAMIEDLDAIIENVDKLRYHRIQIALDDYGTGYSSLVHLRRLRPHELKIDQCFVKTVCDSVEDEKIVRASIQLGHELGALVIAEGVESKQVMNKLEEMGCDAVQGYGIAPPMRSYEFFYYYRHPRFMFTDD